MDNKSVFYKITILIYRVTVTGVLWCIASIPVFTVGAASAAAIAEFADPDNDGTHSIVTLFIHNFRRTFARATLMWLALIAAWIVIIADISVYRGLAGGAVMRTLIMTVVFIAADLSVGIARWGFFLIAAESPRGFRACIKEAVRLTFLHLPTLGVMIVIDSVTALFIFLFPYFIFLMPIVPGIEAYIHTKLYRRIVPAEGKPDGERT